MLEAIKTRVKELQSGEKEAILANKKQDAREARENETSTQKGDIPKPILKKTVREKEEWDGSVPSYNQLIIDVSRSEKAYSQASHEED